MNYSTKHKSISRILSMVLALAMVLTSSAFTTVQANASIRNDFVSEADAVVSTEAAATEEAVVETEAAITEEVVAEEVDDTKNEGKEENVETPADSVEAQSYADGKTAEPEILSDVMYINPEQKASDWAKKNAEGTTVYEESIKVSLNVPAGANAYYTLDGSAPTAASKLYHPEKGIVINFEPGSKADEPKTLSVIAVADGKEPSDVVTKGFAIADNNSVKKYEAFLADKGFSSDKVYGDPDAISFKIGPSAEGGVATWEGSKIEVNPPTYGGVTYTYSAQGKEDCKTSNGGNSPDGSNIMNVGAYLEFTAKADGTVSIVCQSVSGKPYFFTEIDRTKGSVETISTAPDCTGGIMDFPVEAGKTYQFSIKGSKVKVYGITLIHKEDVTHYEKNIDITDGLKAGVDYGTKDVVAVTVNKDFAYNAEESATVDEQKYTGAVQSSESGSAIKFEAKKRGTANLVVDADEGKKVYVNGAEVAALDAAKTVSVPMVAGKSYEVSVKDSNIKIYNISYEAGDEPSKKWRMVKNPVITDIKLSENKDDYIVKVDGVIGNEGGDALKCIMVDKESGEVVLYDVNKTDGKGAEFTFTPLNSGDYEFYAALSREGEPDKTSIIESEGKEVYTSPVDFGLSQTFDLQYHDLAITALTNKYDEAKDDCRVEVSFAKVKEADNYRFVVAPAGENPEMGAIFDQTVKSGDIDGSYVVTGLPESTSDTDLYDFYIYAISNKGEERVKSIDASQKGFKIRKLFVTTWASTTYGTSTTDPTTDKGRENNGTEEEAHYDNGELKTVHVWSTGGKGKIVPASTDGLSFHYTKVAKDKNFTLGADIHVNNWVYSNGQDGFGMMVSDTVYQFDKKDSARWNNSYQLLCSLIEYRYNEEYDILTDAATDYKFNTRLGVLYRAKEGVTTADLPKISTGQIAAPVAWNYYGNAMEASVGKKMAPILRAQGVDPKNTYDCNIIGSRKSKGLKNADRLLTDFKMQIQRVSNAYILRYMDIAYDNDITFEDPRFETVTFANPLVIDKDGKIVPKYSQTSLKVEEVKEKEKDDAGKEIEITKYYPVLSSAKAVAGQLIPVIKKEDGTVEQLVKLVEGTTDKYEIDEARLHEATTGKFGKKVFIDTNRQVLTKLDSNSVYVGFIAARNGDMTAENIYYELQSKNESQYGYDYDTPAEPDHELVAPSYQPTTDTTRFANGETSTVGFSANANGKLSIYDENGVALVAGADVKAGQTAYVSPKVKTGANTLTWSFTPASNYNPGENKEFIDYNTYSDTFEVYRAEVPGTENNEIYVKQTVSKNGIEAKENSNNAIAYAKAYAEGTAPKGTKEDPVDIFTAVSFAKPGQVIKLAGGYYNMTEALEVPKFHRGTKNSMIKMMTDLEDASQLRAVLDFQNIEVAADAFVIWSHYWYFQGFDVIRSQGEKKGIKIGGSYNTLDNIRAYLNSNSGFDNSRQGAKETRAEWPSYNLYLNCSSFMNSDIQSEDGDGFAMKITCGKGNRCVGCLAAFNGDDGWDLYAKSETGNIEPVTVENSIAFANAYLIASDPTGNGDWKFNGQLRVGPGNGNGFKMGGESLSGYHVLRNSVSFGNKADGVTTNSCPDLQVSNVTSWGNEGSNISLYTSKSALNTDFLLKGLISINGGGDTIKGQNGQSEAKIFNESNYYENLNVSEGYTGYEYTKKKPLNGTIEGNKLNPDPEKGDFVNTDYQKVINDFVATTAPGNEAKFLSINDCEAGITRDKNHNICLGEKGDLFKLADTDNAKLAWAAAASEGLLAPGGAETVSRYASDDVVDKAYETTIIAGTAVTLKDIKLDAIDKELVGATWLYEDTKLAPYTGSRASFIAKDVNGAEREVFVNIINVTGVEFLDPNGKSYDSTAMAIVDKNDVESQKWSVKPVYSPASADIANVKAEVVEGGVPSLKITLKEKTKIGVELSTNEITKFDNYGFNITPTKNGIVTLTAAMEFTAKSTVKKSATMTFIARENSINVFDTVEVINDTCKADTVIKCDNKKTVSTSNKSFKLHVGEQFKLTKAGTTIDGKAYTIKPADTSVVSGKASGSDFIFTANKAGMTSITVTEKADPTNTQNLDVRVIGDYMFTTNVPSMELDTSKAEGPEFKIIDIYNYYSDKADPEHYVPVEDVKVRVKSVDGNEAEAAKFKVKSFGSKGLDFRLSSDEQITKVVTSRFVFEVYTIDKEDVTKEITLGTTDETFVKLVTTKPRVKFKWIEPVNYFYTGDDASGKLQITSNGPQIEEVKLYDPAEKSKVSISPSATEKDVYIVTINDDNYAGETLDYMKIDIVFSGYKEIFEEGGVFTYGRYSQQVKTRFVPPKLELEMANNFVYKKLGQSKLSFKLYNTTDGVYVTDNDAEVKFFKQSSKQIKNLVDGLAPQEIMANEKLGLVKKVKEEALDSSSVEFDNSLKGNIWTFDTTKMDLKNLQANQVLRGNFTTYVKLSNWRIGLRVKAAMNIDDKTEGKNVAARTGVLPIYLAGTAGIAGKEVGKTDIKFSPGAKDVVRDFAKTEVKIDSIDDSKAKLTAGLVGDKDKDVLFNLEWNAAEEKFQLTAKLNPKTKEESIPKQSCTYNVTFDVNGNKLKPAKVKLVVQPVKLTTTVKRTINLLDRKGLLKDNQVVIDTNFNFLNFTGISDVSFKAVGRSDESTEETGSRQSDACAMFDVTLADAKGTMYVNAKEDADLVDGSKYLVYPSYKVMLEDGSEVYVTSSKPVTISVIRRAVTYNDLYTELKVMDDSLNETMITVLPKNNAYTLTDLELVNFKDNFETSYDFDKASMKGTGALHIKVKNLNGLKANQIISLQFKPKYDGMSSSSIYTNVVVKLKLYN